MTPIDRNTNSAAAMERICDDSISLPQSGLEPHRLGEQPLVDAEDVRRKEDIVLFQLIDELGPDAGRLDSANDLAIFDARLLEGKDILKDNNLALHTLHLRNSNDLSAA